MTAERACKRLEQLFFIIIIFYLTKKQPTFVFQREKQNQPNFLGFIMLFAYATYGYKKNYLGKV